VIVNLLEEVAGGAIRRYTYHLVRIERFNWNAYATAPLTGLLKTVCNLQSLSVSIDKPVFCFTERWDVKIIHYLFLAKITLNPQ
jgi:hypothetical protein